MELNKLAEQTGQLLRQKALLLSTAESCTGGWVAKLVTDITGSSAWFDRGFVTYSNRSKHEMLGVDLQTLESFGAVSESVAQEMAEGVLAHSAAQVSLAVTGIAGPGGGTQDKPVGTVCFAWSGSFFATIASTQYFKGDREQIRRQAAEFALKGVLDVLE